MKGKGRRGRGRGRELCASLSCSRKRARKATARSRGRRRRKDHKRPRGQCGRSPKGYYCNAPRVEGMKVHSGAPLLFWRARAACRRRRLCCVYVRRENGGKRAAMSEELSVLVEATGAEEGMKEDISTRSVISAGKRSNAAGREENTTQLVTALSPVPSRSLPFPLISALRRGLEGEETKRRAEPEGTCPPRQFLRFGWRERHRSAVLCRH